MTHSLTAAAEALLHPERLYSVTELSTAPTLIPQEGGVYAWWFSKAAWFRSYLKRDEKVESIALRDRALALIARARHGNSVDELQEMQHEVDDILREILVCYDDGAIDEGDLSAFNLVFEQFHHAIADRRTALEDMPQDLARLRSRQ
jgi:hypothetical protein